MLVCKLSLYERIDGRTRCLIRLLGKVGCLFKNFTGLFILPEVAVGDGEVDEGLRYILGSSQGFLKAFAAISSRLVWL
jgi:hypothetical protein